MLATGKEWATIFISLPMIVAPNALGTLTSRNVRRYARWTIAASPTPPIPETTDVLLEKAKTLNPDKEIDAAKVWSGVRN